MIRRFLLPGAVLCGAMLVTGTPRMPADDATPAGSQEAPAAESPEPGAAKTTPGVQFEFDLSSAAGATLTTTNGHDEQREGELIGMYGAYASVPEGQPRPLTLRVTEDNTVNGPDEKPGVLRLQYADVPLESKYSGFLIYGIEDTGKMMMPGWTLGEVTMADLRRTFIEFKFRADNPDNPDSFGGVHQFRIEPEHQDSYGRRADFGALIATKRWRTFRRPISSGDNLDAFLKSVNEDNPAHFKLVWSQNGSIQGYTPGDSLLIDDVKIIIE